MEEDLETLEIYLRTLLCELLKPEDSPVLYLQLIHHLNHALFRANSPIKAKLFSSESDKLVKATMNNKQNKFDKLIHSVNMSENKILREHLTRYSHLDVNCKYGFSLFE